MDQAPGIPAVAGSLDMADSPGSQDVADHRDIVAVVAPGCKRADNLDSTPVEAGVVEVVAPAAGDAAGVPAAAADFENRRTGLRHHDHAFSNRQNLAYLNPFRYTFYLKSLGY